MVLKLSDHPDAMAAAAHGDKLDALAVHAAQHVSLLTEIRNLLKELIEIPKQEAAKNEAARKQADDAKNEAARKQAAGDAQREAARKQAAGDAQREAERRAQAGAETQHISAPADGGLFDEKAPARGDTSVEGRNAHMAAQSGLEQQSQRDNVFHRDVGEKKD